MLEATQEYRGGEDWLKNFLEECCVQKSSAKARSAVLYAQYKAWAADRREYVRTIKDFSAGLELAGFAKVKSMGMMWWLGLGVRDDVECRAFNYNAEKEWPPAL